MFDESNLLPLSALQHLVFCERQCALIHLEQLWADNRLTAEGRAQHERSDEPGTEVRGDVRIARALPLCCLRLGLVGKADVVEFRQCEDNEPGAVMPGLPGRWRPFPVEHKRGKPKKIHCDEAQLCAQALCLEEMLECDVPRGALFYGTTKRRKEVPFDESLRRETETLAERLHDLIALGRTPPAVFEPKCKQCSLIDLCMPHELGKSAKRYVSEIIMSADVPPEEPTP